MTWNGGVVRSTGVWSDGVEWWGGVERSDGVTWNGG